MNKKTINSFLLASLLVLSGYTNAGPAPGNGVALTIESAMEQDYTDDKGKPAKRLVPVTRIIPGDEVIYTIRFVNNGSQPASNVVIANPIPPELTYREGSGFGPGSVIEFSADGGKTWATANALRVPAAQGGTRPAVPADYTHIRWRLNAAIPAGQTGFVRFRAVLK